MFAAIPILTLLAAGILLMLIRVARKAPEGYEDKDGFHLGKTPDQPPVPADEAGSASLPLFWPFEGSVRSPTRPEPPASDS